MKAYLIIAVSLFLFACKDEEQKQVPSVGKLSRFIPKGYFLFESKTQDLNQDSIDDFLLILHSDTDSLAPENPLRLLILVLKQKDGTLKQMGRNDYLLSGQVCGAFGGGLGYYYPELSINEDKTFGLNMFYFHCGMGHSSTTIIFEYSKKKNNWLLKEYIYNYTSDTPTEEGGYDNNEGSFEKTDKDFGEISFNDYKGL